MLGEREADVDTEAFGESVAEAEIEPLIDSDALREPLKEAVPLTEPLDVVLALPELVMLNEVEGEEVTLLETDAENDGERDEDCDTRVHEPAVVLLSGSE